MPRRRLPFTVYHRGELDAAFHDEIAARWYCARASGLMRGMFELRHATGLVGQYEGGKSTPEFEAHHRAIFPA